MLPVDVKCVREVFGFKRSDLARALNIASYTVARWEEGTSSPTGTAQQVMIALVAMANQCVQADTATKQRIGDRIRLGVATLVFESVLAAAARERT